LSRNSSAALFIQVRVNNGVEIATDDVVVTG